MRHSTAPMLHRDESGMALLIAVLMLLMISAIGLSAMDHAGSDAQFSGRSRRNTITFHAADGGIQYGRSRVLDVPPDLGSFSITLTDGTQFRSGPRSAGTPTVVAPPGVSPPPDGFSINVGSGTGFYDETKRWEVTSTALDGAQVELETKVAQIKGGYGGNY